MQPHKNLILFPAHTTDTNSKSIMSHIRLKETKRAKPLWHFLLIRTAVRWGMFTLRSALGLYDVAHIPWSSTYMRVWEQGHNCRRFPGLDQQPSSSGRSARLAAAFKLHAPDWETERQWQAELSAEHCVSDWRVSLIWLRANLIAFHIIFIFLKLSGDCALGRRWHSLEMSSVSSHGKKQSDTHKQTEAHAYTHRRMSNPSLHFLPLPCRHTPADSLEHYTGCN